LFLFFSYLINPQNRERKEKKGNRKAVVDKENLRDLGVKNISKNGDRKTFFKKA
jgi:hypothetical protein